MKNSPVLWIVIGVLVAGALAFGGMYNGLASGKVAAEELSSNIDVELQRQSDLIPNLVNSVKGQLAHEDKAITAVTDARKAYVGAQTPADKLAAGANMNQALGRLLVVVENYPNLVSQQAVKDLMVALEGTQNRIEFARTKYNAGVGSYNRMTVSFPTNIVANMFGLQKLSFFEAAADARNTPTVDLVP